MTDEMPLDTASHDSLGLCRLLNIVLSDGLHAGFDGFPDFFRSPGLGSRHELDVRRESLEDGGDAFPDHKLIFTRNRDGFQESSGKFGHVI
jgi:hypothetical protein